MDVRELSGWGFFTLAGGKRIKAACALTLTIEPGKTVGNGSIDTGPETAEEMLKCKDGIDLELNGHKAKIAVTRASGGSKVEFDTIGRISVPN
jgi:hypothetical protein